VVLHAQAHNGGVGHEGSWMAAIVREPGSFDNPC